MTEHDAALSEPELPEPTLMVKYAQLHALLDEIDGLSDVQCSDAQVIAVAEAHERAARRMAGIGHRRVLDVSDRDAHTKAGFRSLPDFMTERLRICDPRRRQRHMSMLARLRSMQGELLDPRCPHLANALAEGAIGPDHAQAVLDVLAKIPSGVDTETAASAEATMATLARDYAPKQLIQLGARMLAHLDPDGTLTDSRDRARRRRLSVGIQDPQLMSKLVGELDPTTRAMLDVVLAAWAAPGVNNPGDENSPTGTADGVDPSLLRDAARRDERTVGQRQHDALTALLRAALDGRLLGGSHRGMPAHVVITMSEGQLRDRAGIAATASGTDLPIGDMAKLAAQVQPHLAVFADHTSELLYLGRGARLASQAQRLALFATHGGCSHPDCSQPATHVEAHHAAADWADGGTTDVDSLGPACPRHNRMVGPLPGQWTTTVIDHGPDAGRIGWSRNPEPGMPPNPVRVNRFHHINDLVRHLGSDSTRSTIARTADSRCAPTPPIPSDSASARPVPARSALTRPASVQQVGARSALTRPVSAQPVGARSALRRPVPAQRVRRRTTRMRSIRSGASGAPTTLAAVARRRRRPRADHYLRPRAITVTTFSPVRRE
ncbi:hypothetical protein GCM10009624_17680 [Gordonia sinesedis]